MKLIQRTGRRSRDTEADIIEQLRRAVEEGDDVEFENIGPIKHAIVAFPSGDRDETVIWLAWIEARASGAWKKLVSLLLAAEIDLEVVLDTQDPKLVRFWKHQGFHEIDFEEACDMVGDNARPDATTLVGYY